MKVRSDDETSCLGEGPWDQVAGKKIATGSVVAMRKTGDGEIGGAGTQRLRSADEIVCRAGWRHVPNPYQVA